MDPSFIYTFDALDVKGKVPSDEEIAAGSIKEPDGWNIISPKQKALDVELGAAAEAGGPEPSRSHARSGSVLPVLKRWYTSSEQLNAPFESRVRGLLLGLAVGDAVGSKESDLSTTGLLEAGVATQLAAWTVEGTLRAFTRYGVFQPHLPDIVLRAYHRWARCCAVLNPSMAWSHTPTLYQSAAATRRGSLDGSSTSQRWRRCVALLRRPNGRSSEIVVW